MVGSWCGVIGERRIDLIAIRYLCLSRSVVIRRRKAVMSKMVVLRF